MQDAFSRTTLIQHTCGRYPPDLIACDPGALSPGEPTNHPAQSTSQPSQPTTANYPSTRIVQMVSVHKRARQHNNDPKVSNPALQICRVSALKVDNIKVKLSKEKIMSGTTNPANILLMTI